MIKFGLIVWILLLLVPRTGQSQSFGGNPPSVHWHQINTPEFRIIFPGKINYSGEKVASILHGFQNAFGDTAASARKINVVLQNRTIRSNGYVSLGPFRSEFYTTPPQNSLELGSIPWIEMLSIHEYQHIRQDRRFNVGMSKVMSTLFGESGQALANHAAIPDWYYEGDAVYYETNTSRQGRGALPYFYKGFRALWEANKSYSWMKLRNGSYTNFVPNEYPLGFMLVAYGREKYGQDFWIKVTRDAAAYKNLFYPFQKAIKRYSGISFHQFRRDALDYFKEELNSQKEIPNKKIKPDFYQNNQLPVYTDDGDLIFLKSSVQQLLTFIIKKNGKETKIRTADPMPETYYSYRNGKIVYAAWKPDLRWGNRAYSELKLLNVATGKQRRITRYTRYFSPDINNKGDQIIAVNVPPTGYSSLQIINTANGKVLKTYANPKQLVYSYPKFYGDQYFISVVRNKEGKTSIARINRENDSSENLIPFTDNAISFPYLHGDTLYYTSSYKTHDELFAYTFANHKLWKIGYDKLSGLGKYQPSVHGNRMVWSTFTSEGFRLQGVPMDSLQFTKTDTARLIRITSSFGLASVNNRYANLLYRVKDSSYPIKRYQKWKHLFNFHSLIPAVDDPKYALSLVSENILNTLQSDFSLSYDRSEQSKGIGFHATYGGWFPQLSAGADFTFDRSLSYHQKQVRYQQFETFAGINIPLNLSSGRNYTYLSLGSYFTNNQSYVPNSYKDSFQLQAYNYLNNYISFSRQTGQALRDIFPKFAQTLSLSYKTSLSGVSGQQGMIKGALYFPGLFPNQSLVLRGAYLRKDSLREINFSSGFPFSRGYHAANFYRMNYWGVNYHLPLAYPDAGFGNLVYLLRLRTNLFYDATTIKLSPAQGNMLKQNFNSVGIELFADTKWWNQAAISFGVRYSHLLNKDLFGNTGSGRWEIILPVNILNP